MTAHAAHKRGQGVAGCGEVWASAARSAVLVVYALPLLLWVEAAAHA
jgi:hypothetical protein